MYRKRCDNIMCDQTRGDQGVIYCMNGNRDVLKTSGKMVPIGKHLRDTGCGHAAVNGHECADGLSGKERVIGINKWSNDSCELWM